MISIYSSSFITIYVVILFFILGSVFGSFLNCVAYRIKENIPWWKGRSKCDYCDHELSILDLFPVFSYVFSGGKCRYCGHKLSVKYLLTEVVLGLLFVFFILNYGILDINLINYLGLICILFGLSLCDLNTYEIPDGYIIMGIVLWLIFTIINGYDFKTILLSIGEALVVPFIVLLISLVMDKILKKESMGGGDIKLLFLVGLYLGLISSILNLIISCIIGLVMVLLLKKDKIPFGPAIALGTYISLLYGSYIVTWYINLIV